MCEEKADRDGAAISNWMVLDKCLITRKLIGISGFVLYGTFWKFEGQLHGIFDFGMSGDMVKR